MEHDLFHHLSKLSCTWLWMSPQNAFSDLSSYKDEQHLKQSKELKLKFKEVTQMSGVTLLPDFNKWGPKAQFNLFITHTSFCGVRLLTTVMNGGVFFYFHGRATAKRKTHLRSLYSHLLIYMFASKTLSHLGLVGGFCPF